MSYREGGCVKKKKEREIYIIVDLPKEINSKFMDVDNFEDPSKCKNDDELAAVVARHATSTTVGVILGAMVEVFMDNDSGNSDEGIKELIRRLEESRELYHEQIDKNKKTSAHVVFKGISGGIESFIHDMRGRLGGRNGQ